MNPKFISLLIVAASGIAAAQSPVISSTNPTFGQYYSVVQNGGPVYAFGTSAAPYTWNVTTSAVGDFLGRGTPQILLGGTDFAPAWQPSPVRLLVNSGNGTFYDGSAYMSSAPTPIFTLAIPTADFNGDGKPDIFLANLGIDAGPKSGESDSLLLSAPGGQLLNASSGLPASSDFSAAAAAAALNGDNVIDIYVGTQCCGNTPYFLINDGKGNFTKDFSRLPPELQTARNNTNVYGGAALVDVNNDGFPDLVLGSAYAAISKIYLNDGQGSFANSSPILLPPGCFDSRTPGGTEVVSITASDLRHTGQQDLIFNEVWANGEPPNGYNAACIQILVNDGTGHFTDQTTLRGAGNLLSQVAPGNYCNWTFVVDVNGDGYPDLVLAPVLVTANAPNLVLLNDGHGFFTSTPPDFFPTNGGGGYGYMIPVDLNGQGKIGFVQPYNVHESNGETTLQFAVYQPITALPTPASPSATYVPVTITSTPPGAPVTVTGTGCAPGTYPAPANLLWDANSNCTLSFASFYLRDPETGAVFNDNQQYVFANATVGSGAPASANPQTIAVGTTPLSINAVFNPAPLAPPGQNSVLEFAAGQQIAVAAQPVSVGDNFTLEAWVSASQSPNGFIMGKLATGDTYANYGASYAIIGTVGMLAFQQSTSVPATFPFITVSTPSPVPLDTWIHVAAVLNSGIMQLYIDGDLVATGSSPGPTAGQSVPFSLGAGTLDGQSVCCGFVGSIRQARVWSRALSAAEIQTYATTVLTGNEDGLVADWPLDDGSGLTARNVVPSGATLNLMNGPTWAATGTIGLATTAFTPSSSGIAQNTWVEIQGANLVPSTTPSTGIDWSSAPSFAQGQMPTTLNGISVTIDGIPAYIYFYCSAATDTLCSQDQINVLSPLDNTLGAVPVVVSNNGVPTTAFTATMHALVPALFNFDGSHVVATHLNYTLVGPTSLYPGASTPAAPGETIVVYGSGFGIPPGAAIAAGSSTQSGTYSSLPTCTINGVNAPVGFAGLVDPGLVQLNVTIPSTAANGDNPIACTINGLTTPAGNVVTVQQ